MAPHTQIRARGMIHLATKLINQIKLINCGQKCSMGTLVAIGIFVITYI
jgi:hypothetical protein